MTERVTIIENGEIIERIYNGDKFVNWPVIEKPTFLTPPPNLLNKKGMTKLEKYILWPLFGVVCGLLVIMVALTGN